MLEGQEHLKRIQEQLKASEEERKVYERMLKQERVMYQQLLAEKEHITNQLIEFRSESEAKLNEKRNICEDLRHKNSVLQIEAVTAANNFQSLRITKSVLERRLSESILVKNEELTAKTIALEKMDTTIRKVCMMNL